MGLTVGSFFGIAGLTGALSRPICTGTVGGGHRSEAALARQRRRARRLTVSMAGVVAALDLPLPYLLEVLFAKDKGGGFSGALFDAPVLGAAFAEEGSEGEEEGDGGEDEEDGAAPAFEEHDAGRACGGEVSGGRGRGEEHAAAGGEEEGPVGDEDAEVAVADAGDGEVEGPCPGGTGAVGVRLALELFLDGSGQLAHPIHLLLRKCGWVGDRCRNQISLAVAVLNVAADHPFSPTLISITLHQLLLQALGQLSHPRQELSPTHVRPQRLGYRHPLCTRQFLRSLQTLRSTYLGRLVVLHQTT